MGFANFCHMKNMWQDYPLTAALLEYRRTGRGRAELIDRVALFIYRYPARRFRKDPEFCSDFLYYFYPRIEKDLDRFLWTGKPYEAYLCKTLRMQMLSYYSVVRKRQQDQYIFSDPLFWPEASSRCTGETLLSYGPGEGKPPYFRLTEEGTVPPGPWRRRLLILALKSCAALGPDQLDRIAGMLDCNRAWFFDAVEELRQGVAQRERRREALKERRNTLLMRLCRYEKRLKLPLETPERKELERKTAVCQMRLHLIAETLQRIPPAPSNRAVSRVMGIPKGSVDSGLFRVRKIVAARKD